jgi:hypothetical protein
MSDHRVKISVELDHHALQNLSSNLTDKVTEFDSRLLRKQQENTIKNQLDSLRKRFMDELTFQTEIIESAKSEILNKKEEVKISIP